jgi:hypothetical protein
MAHFYLDRFEDGDVSEWSTPSSGSFTADSGSQLSGTYSGQLQQNASQGNTGRTFSDRTQDTYLEFRGFQSGTATDVSRIQVFTDGSTLIASVRFFHDGSISVNGSSVTDTWSADTYYELTFDWDFANNEVTVSLGATTLSTEALVTNADNWNRVQLHVDTVDSATEQSAFIDDIAYLDAPEAPDDVRASTVSGDRIDLTWAQPAETPDSHNVYVDESSGSAVGDYTQVTSLSGSVTSYSHTGLEDGERKYYRVTAEDSYGESALSAETDATTALPQTNIDTVDNTTEDQLTLSWTKQDDSTDGDWSIYTSRTGDTFSAAVTGLAPSTSSHTLTGLRDGERYWLILRRETDHRSSDSNTLITTTVLPAPSALSVDSVSSDAEVALSWADNAEEEDAYRVQNQLADESTWSDLATLSPDTTSYTTDPIIATDPVSFRVVAETEHTTATSGTVSTTTVSVPADAYAIKLIDADGSVRDLVERPDAGPFDELVVRREPTALSDWEVRFHTADFAKLEQTISPTTDSLIYYDQSLLFRGFATTLQADTRDATVTVSGKDILQTLARGETTRRFQNVPTHEAIETYFDAETSVDATVVAPSPTTIVDDRLAIDVATQAEWEGVVSPGQTDPYALEGGDLVQLQTCFTAEGDNPDRGVGPIKNDPEYSDGDALALNDTSEYGEWEFSLEYDIPDGEFNVFFRGTDTGDDQPDITWKLDGTTIGKTNIAGLGLQWHDLKSISSSWADPGRISAGSHTLRADVSASGTDEWHMDVVAPLDTRYSYTFDNDNGGSGGYLDGPEHYPEVDIDLAAFTDNAANITSATLDAQLNDITGAQALQASVVGTSGPFQSAANTSTATLTFPDTVGTNLYPRVQLGRGGIRDDATPQTGYIQQAVEVLEVRFDGNDLSVLDDRELRRDHFSNLRALHEEADYVWAADYHPSAIRVDSFPRGETASLPDVTINNRRVTYDTEGYANRVVVEGGQQDDGSRPRAADKDEAEVQAKGETLTRHIKDPNLDSQQACESRVRSTLPRLTGVDERKNRLDIDPVDVQPGYVHDIPSSGDQNVCRRVTYRLAYGDVSASLEYAGDADLARWSTDANRGVEETRDSL